VNRSRCVEQAILRGEIEHDIGELAAAAQDHGEPDYFHEVELARHLADRAQHQHLQHDHREHDDGDFHWLLFDELQVERNADADEEQTEQQTLERLDLRIDFMAVFRIREQHAGEKCAERHLHAGQLHQPGSAEHDEQCGRREHFRNLQAGDDTKNRTQQQPATDDHARNHRDDFQTCPKFRSAVAYRFAHAE
jgi:hypothetical protein